MPAGQGLRVDLIAQAVLDAVVAHLARAPRPVPERQIIAPGNARLIAWDVEQVVVTLTGINPGQSPTDIGPTPRVGGPVSAAGLRHAVLAVQIVRCVPESKDGHTPPKAEHLTLAGLGLMRDAGLLSQALVELCETVPAAIGPGTLAAAGAVEVLGPDGGTAAVEGTLSVTAGVLS